MSNICTIWEPSYEQKRDLGHITLKIVAHDEQKRDSAQITLKIVTDGWRTAGKERFLDKLGMTNVYRTGHNEKRQPMRLPFEVERKTRLELATPTMI